MTGLPAVLCLLVQRGRGDLHECERREAVPAVQELRLHAHRERVCALPAGRGARGHCARQERRVRRVQAEGERSGGGRRVHCGGRQVLREGNGSKGQI